MKTSPTQPLKSFGIDPRTFQGQGEAPVLWGISPRVRIRIMDCVIHDLARHPETQLGQCWHRIRDEVVDEDGTTVSKVLSCPEIASPVWAVDDVVKLLLSLRAERALIEEKHRLLDSLEETFASDPEKP